MTFTEIRIERPEPNIARVVVARADTGNASQPKMLGEIRDAFLKLDTDPEVCAILFAAEGKHFSVGADFGFLDGLTRTAAVDIKSTVYANFQGAAKAIYRCSKPTVALVQGAAVTVGCELALACDFRVASDSSFFQESWIKLGIMPPLGGVFLLPRLIGMGPAAEMLLKGKQIRAQEALSIGLVSEVVAYDALSERGLELGRELAGAAPLAYATIKESLHRAVESSMETEWQANVSNQALLLGSEDFREGLDAVKGKRTPRFKGR